MPETSRPPSLLVPMRLLWEEPFRVFFPLAVLATLAGVSLWPLHHAGVLVMHPGVTHMHARVMTVALAGFLIGFMGTAAPRLLDARPFRWWETGGLLVLWLTSLVAHFLNFRILEIGGRFMMWIQVGDGLFAATIVILLLVLSGRWFGSSSTDTPPPGFPVAMAGLLAGAGGAAALAWNLGAWMSPGGYQLSKLLLYQALPLLPLVGVAPFLLPRFYGHPSSHRFDESPVPPAGWWRRFGVCSGAGVLLVLSFVLESRGWPRSGMGMRALVCAGVFLFETPVFRRAAALTTPGTAVRWSILSLVLALAWALFDPVRRIGILHLFFASGIGLVMLATGTRVVLGHAGRHDLLTRRMRWLVATAILIVLAAATRVSADFLLEIRDSHLDYAAYSWIAGAGLWLGMLGRFFLATEPDEETPPPRQCRKFRGRGGNAEQEPPGS